MGRAAEITITLVDPGPVTVADLTPEGRQALLEFLLALKPPDASPQVALVAPDTACM